MGVVLPSPGGQQMLPYTVPRSSSQELSPLDRLIGVPTSGPNPFAGMVGYTPAPARAHVQGPATNGDFNFAQDMYDRFSGGQAPVLGPEPAISKPQQDFLDMLMQQLLHPASSASVLNSAMSSINQMYAPQLSALDKLVAQKKSTESGNEVKLKDMYNQLVANTKSTGKEASRHYDDLMGKQSASTQAERNAITQRYNQQIADMTKQMTDSGFANLIPVRTQKIQEQMDRELANINTQGDIAQNQSRGLQGSQNNWYNSAADIHSGEGTNAISASMSQLQNILNKLDMQRANILSSKAKDVYNAKQSAAAAAQPNMDAILKIYQLQQDAKNSKNAAAAKAAQQKIDNIFKMFQLGKGSINGTTGQSTFDQSLMDRLQAALSA